MAQRVGGSGSLSPADVQQLIDDAVSGVTKSSLGLGNVDNTSDTDKPVSDATNLALALKADDPHDHDDLYYTESEVDGMLGGILPDQAGNAGKILSTDGTEVSWVAGGDVASVNGQTGDVDLDADDIDDASTDHKFVTASDLVTLSNTSGTNTGDQDLSAYVMEVSLADVAMSGDYDDLSGRPAIPSTLAALDTTVTGTQLNALKSKVDGIDSGATMNSSDATLLSRANHTGTQSADTVVDGTTNKAFTATEKTKLSGIATAATANDTDANLKNRANHTGTQTVSTITATGTPSATTYLRGDGSWATPANTTYSEMPEAEITAGTATTLRTLSGRRAQFIVNKATNRANHTGNQAISTITNLQEILDGKPIVVDPGNFSTAIGHDAQSPGNSSLAAGHGAAAIGFYATAVGMGAVASGDASTAVGMNTQASGNSTIALGYNAEASASFASAIGDNAGASGAMSIAIGRGATAEAINSGAIGRAAKTTETVDDNVYEIAGEVLRIIRRQDGTHAPLAIPTTLQIADATGALHTIGVHATNGLTYDGVPVGVTHSFSANTSPGGENLTGVGTYATAGVLQTGTLQSFIPEITAGLWDVDIEAHALVYRSVATGGVYLWVGNGTTSYQQALGRLAPQTNAYTLNVNVSPSTVGGTALKSVSPTQVIDMRYTGFSTAGTTYVVNHGWKITARRVG